MSTSRLGVRGMRLCGPTRAITRCMPRLMMRLARVGIVISPVTGIRPVIVADIVYIPGQEVYRTTWRYT